MYFGVLGIYHQTWKPRQNIFLYLNVEMKIDKSRQWNKKCITFYLNPFNYQEKNTVFSVEKDETCSNLKINCPNKFYNGQKSFILTFILTPFIFNHLEFGSAS